MKNLHFANRFNAEIIDEYYERWVSNSEDVSPDWQAFFEGFELALTQPRKPRGAKPAETKADLSEPSDGNGLAPVMPPLPHDLQRATPIIQSRIIGAIYAYRSIGHTQAQFNPLHVVPPNPRLSLSRLGLDGVDLHQEYHTGNYLGGVFMTISDLLERLQQTYCGSIGVEYIHIQETPKRRWLQARMEPENNQPQFGREEQIRILEQIFEAETFERFLHTKFVGQKRFSLEGAETTIAALDSLIESCPKNGVEEIVLGMAHRGRLNVLANIMGKSYDYVFREFSENYIPQTIHGDGDVKYHLGYESVRKTSDGGEVELRLAANPSHLEAVDPVVCGKARARQRIRGDFERKRVLPLLIHGDAAFAGQGVVMETLNLSRLKGYTTGGTIHFVINNQIGFTTDPRDARSSRYCTDIAKMIEVPIFHVDGDNPLAVVQSVKLALEYRQTFGDDVVIDMYCYRRHGHNESDEPGFTQPDLYKRIKRRTSISEGLRNKLVDAGTLSEAEAESLVADYQKQLDEAHIRSQHELANGVDPVPSGSEDADSARFSGSAGIQQAPFSFDPVDTRVALERLEKVAQALTNLPENFKVNSKIRRQRESAWDAFQQGVNIDWGFAEQLSWGSLMLEGTPVRISGQDSERGTFSHRHAGLYDTENRARYVPLLNIEPGQAIFCVHNSSLSEAAVLGFDFGYSLDYPEMLAIWEAQFGDFANGAQVHFDQFIASSESKWGRVSGIVLLLPHGYEGQGPEHSSARLERFLQACAENNIQVANLTTPAQYFHILRRQMHRTFRKPLVIMAPKSLLRHKRCVSTVEELTDGTFHEFIDDSAAGPQVDRVILCSGKVYYDLLAERESKGLTHAAIVRVEQLYPFHAEQLNEIFSRYKKGSAQLVWCQEEPRNMGAWSFIFPRLIELGGGKMPIYAGRDEAASPAPGTLARHREEQQQLVQDAFNLS